jgi:hypothetical protein
MTKFNLIVAEGHWSNHSNHSVKSLFDLLSDLLRSNNHSYKYTQFANPTAFSSSIAQLLDANHKYLYIGSHGYNDGIYGTDDADPLTFTKLKNNLAKFSGLYLGTCLFGHPYTLIRFVENSSLTWCAGYKNSVDWVDSSALDLAFWKIFQIYNTQKGKKVELSMIESTIKELRSKYSSLILDLGFNVAIRRKDEKGTTVIEMAF